MGRADFKASGRKLVFDGFMKVTGVTTSTGDQILPELQTEQTVQPVKVSPTQHFTSPPPRYTEASLVKELESNGIGRPSTYAQIIYTLKTRKYVDLQERRLIPTELGFAVTKILAEHFQKLFDVSFTANMEEELDDIEEGKIEWTKVLADFYEPFEATMDSLKGKAQEIKESMVEKTEENCDKCGLPMVIKWGRNGRFLACSGYPECKTTRPLNGEEETVESGETCEKCGAPMLVKTGRFGKFLGCSNYPQCKNTKAISTGVSCPKDGCEGNVVERRSKRGRTFFGCSRYPKCDFVSWNKPVDQKCKACGHAYIVEKTTKAKGDHLYCPECKTVSYPESSEEHDHESADQSVSP